MGSRQSVIDDQQEPQEEVTEQEEKEKEEYSVVFSQDFLQRFGEPKPEPKESNKPKRPRRAPQQRPSESDAAHSAPPKQTTTVSPPAEKEPTPSAPVPTAAPTAAPSAPDASEAVAAANKRIASLEALVEEYKKREEAPEVPLKSSIQTRIDELKQREFNPPPPHPRAATCAAAGALVERCYAANRDEVLRCADAVNAYAACARSLQQKVSPA